MGKLFGTDGVRGLVNQEPMTPVTLTKLGLAVAAFLRTSATALLLSPPSPPPARQKRHGKNNLTVLLGEDTRLSSRMVASALAAGLCAGGVDVLSAGVLPTPAVAYLTRYYHLAAGIVVSASHNPFEDNGIKVFTAHGGKLSSQAEEAIETSVAAASYGGVGGELLARPEAIGVIEPFSKFIKYYGDFAVASYPSEGKIAALPVVLDCANGATSFIAPSIFGAVGAQVITIHNNPNGKNINDACGSQHTESLAKAVLANRAACGFAFDGDGDRVIAVDETGRTLTGDQILTICGIWLKNQGKLRNNTIVRTVMSNQGMTNALRERGIGFVMTDVGDKLVAEAMATSGAVLGGEDSGHIIFGDLLPTGDGILTALHLLAVMADENKPLSELAKLMEVLPQTLINVPTKTRRDFMECHAVAQAITAVQNELGKTGRLLVRYSGTQNLCRVMVEAPLAAQAQTLCARLARIIKENLA